jgi:hypothetical protein
LNCIELNEALEEGNFMTATQAICPLAALMRFRILVDAALDNAQIESAEARALRGDKLQQDWEWPHDDRR